MKFFAFLSLVILLTACQPKSLDSKHAESFICKSLITGYLNASKLKQFEYYSITYKEDQHIYTYKQPTVSGMVLGIPKMPEMNFGCKKESNTYQVTFIYPDNTQDLILQLIDSPEPL